MPCISCTENGGGHKTNHQTHYTFRSSRMQLRSQVKGKRLATRNKRVESVSGKTNRDAINSSTVSNKKKSKNPQSSVKGKRLRPTSKENAPNLTHAPLDTSSSNEEEYSSDDNDNADGASGATGRQTPKFACAICGNCYTRKVSLSNHMNLHSGARLFECQYCAKTFSRPSSLRKHRKTHFPPTYQCDYCPKMFTQKSNRDRHMNTHTGAKPFYCEHCNKRFAHPGDLSKHRDTHFEPKFECPFCHKKFAELKYCKRHWNGGKNHNIVCKVRLQQLAKQ